MNVVSLIPAIIGGREKHGKSLQKLNVLWAEDVYDPPPSIGKRKKEIKEQIQFEEERTN